MSTGKAVVPHGFGPILRSSPVLDALGGFMSRGDGEALEIGLLVGPTHLNARGRLHGGVTATLLDVAIGYMLAARGRSGAQVRPAFRSRAHRPRHGS